MNNYKFITPSLTDFHVKDNLMFKSNALHNVLWRNGTQYF